MSNNCAGGSFCLIFPMRQWIIYRVSTAIPMHATNLATLTITGMNNGFYRRDGDITIMIWTQTASTPVLTRPVSDFFRITPIAYNF